MPTTPGARARSVTVTAEYNPASSANIGQMVGAIRDRRPFVILWNSHLYLVDGVNYDQIVDQNHPFSFGDRVLVHLHVVEPVFERIGDRDRVVRQLALLADRHEARRQLMRDRAAQDEPARLDASDLVDLRSGPGLHEFVDGAAKGLGVAEQRRDVAKCNALLRIVGDRADGVGEKHGEKLDSGRSPILIAFAAESHRLPATMTRARQPPSAPVSGSAHGRSAPSTEPHGNRRA